MIYLIRHGIDDESRVGGYSDVELTIEGIKGVEEQTKHIKNLKINKIYTSDIVRAKQTTEIINKELNLEVEECKELRELDKGNLTGKVKSTLSEEELKNLNTKDIYEKISTGESMYEFYLRIKALYESGFFNDKDNSLIVTHRGVINMLYNVLRDEQPTMDKTKYGVTHGSVHELDIKKELIKKLY